MVFGRCRERYRHIRLLYMLFYSSLPRKGELVLLNGLLLRRNFSRCPVELSCCLTGKDAVPLGALCFGCLLCVITSMIFCSV